MKRLKHVSGPFALASLIVFSLFFATLNLPNDDHAYHIQFWVHDLRDKGLLTTLVAQVSNYTAPYLVVLHATSTAFPSASSLQVMQVTGLIFH